MPKWTPQQEALFDAAINNTENILVQGVAGCAKSTSGKESVKRIKNGKIGWIAYNNHIVAEIKPKLEQYASVSTLHSLGRSLIGKMFPSIGEPDEAKAKKILESMKPQWFYPKRSGGTGARDAAEACLKLAKLCKYTLSDESDFSTLEELVDHFGIEMPSYGASEDEIFEHVSKVIERGLEDTSSIDFDDMIFWPVRNNMNIDKFDTLFIDELQDFNLCQQTLARKAGNRLIGLGDSRQSLYSWAGADTESMGRFKTALDQTDRHCIEKPLTVTFRCPVSHVEIAKRIVPYIEHAENAIEGIIRQIHPTEAGFELMPGDLAICRCNAPLVSLAYSMITSGIPTLMRGRDIGQGLTGLIARLKPDNPEDLARKLADYERKELDRLDRRNGSDQQKQSIQDRVQCLESLCSQMPNIAELTRFIQELFTEDGGNGKVVLSSVHRAKGLEANRVVIVAPEKLFMLRKNAKDWERTEAANVAYVSITRAKQELIFAGDIPAIFRGANNGNQTDIGNTSCQSSMFKV